MTSMNDRVETEQALASFLRKAWPSLADRADDLARTSIGFLHSRPTEHIAGTLTFDSSEPDWWLNGEALPDGWTVQGDLVLRGPDDHWVGLHFEAAPADELLGVVTGQVTEGSRVPPSPV